MNKDKSKLSEIDIETIATRKQERMSNQQRSEYLSERIRDFVHQNPDGVSTLLVAKTFGIQQDIARRHLETLSKLREIFSTSVNRSTKVYFPNGKLIHPFLQVKKDFNDKSFRISINQIGNREVVHIQEMKYSLLAGETPEGGILIDVNDVNLLLETVKNLVFKMEELKHAK